MNTLTEKKPWRPEMSLGRLIAIAVFASMIAFVGLGAIVPKDNTPIDPQTSRDLNILIGGMHAARQRGWDVNFNGLYLDVTVKSRDPSYADAFAYGLCNGEIKGVTPGKYEIRVYLIDGSLASQCTIMGLAQQEPLIPSYQGHPLGGPPAR